MPRNKLRKYAELREFPNVFCGPDPRISPGHWHERYFKNDNPITLEVGCGTAMMTLGLARQQQSGNFIGIDNKGARLWVGAKTAMDEGLSNTAFLYDRAERITEYFAPGEVAAFWITFPDPFPKPSQSGKRLISGEYIQLYRRICSPEASVYLKTDDSGLFKFALSTLKQLDIVPDIVIADLHTNGDVPDQAKIRTVYEERHLAAGKSIMFLMFRLVS